MATPRVLRVVEREVVAFRHLWRGWLSSLFLRPVLFLGAMGFGLGSLIQEGSGRVDGLDYLVFVAPGLLAAETMLVASQESLWPIMLGTKWLGTYHGMVATPLRPADIYDGHLVWVALRATVTSTLFVAAAALLGAVPSFWAPLAVPAAVLTATAFAAPLAAYSVKRETDVTFALIVRLGVLPMFLFSGTFFPVEQLPDSLQPAALVSPLWHGVELCRGATAGRLGAASSLAHVAFLVAVIVAGRWWGQRSFPKKLTA